MITSSNRGFAWHGTAAVRAKGYVFDAGGRHFRGEAIPAYFASAVDAESMHARLREATGCFAVIVETERFVLAAVDLVRSIPLFYAIKAGEVVVGDDVDAIQRELGGVPEVDPVSRAEFLKIGYVTGPHTRDPRIGQIEAGEFYIWDKAARNGSARLYFSHARGNDTDKPEDVLVDELDLITDRWTRRLIDSADGRTLVIPLSGGYDSRYVACALKRMGCARVMCYSYGTRTSSEWQTAREVAGRLGYPIRIVEYGRANWRAAIESPQFLEYCRYASQHCAVPCIQELVAAEQMAIQHAFPEDAVIVPGYGGDVQAGNYIPLEVLQHREGELLAEGIDHYLYRTRYGLTSTPIGRQVEAAILRRIHAFTAQYRSDDISSFCGVFDAWWVRNRSAKFIVNTVRTHEWFGHEWRLPLWDQELIRWWDRIPLCFRLNSRLYHRFLFERLFDPQKVGFRKTEPPPLSAKPKASRLPPAGVKIVRWLYWNAFVRYGQRKSDVDAFDGIPRILHQNSPTEWNLSEIQNINGAMAAWCDAHRL